MSGLIGHRQEPLPPPLREQPIATLNRALTEEVIRHARTRRQLQKMVAWYWLLESAEVGGDA